jgi:glucose-6-phosphate 1-dehydrogenase
MGMDVFIIGGDGDLALRKLYPSLYYLEVNDSMPDDLRILARHAPGSRKKTLFRKFILGSRKVSTLNSILKTSGHVFRAKFILLRVTQPKPKI